MRKGKNFDFLILISIIILIFSFYWFKLRPQQIRKYCSSQARIGAQNKCKQKARLNPDSKSLQDRAKEDFFLREDYEYCYELCLKQRGLKK